LKGLSEIKFDRKVVIINGVAEEIGSIIQDNNTNRRLIEKTIPKTFGDVSRLWY
jgi:hypothetical protein